MKKIFKALKFPVIFILFLSCFIACDKEFSTIDSDVLGEGNANFFSSVDTLSIAAYNKKLEALQVNNLASNLLGVFNDQEYGRTTASIVTQLTPASFTEDFDVNPVIDSVVINIPYFSTANDTDVDGNLTYQLDSIYGTPGAEFKLTIYENTYYLRDFDPSGSTITSQNFYSKAEELTESTHNYALTGTQEIDFDNFIGDVIFDNIVTPSADVKVLTTGEGEDLVSTRSLPAFRVCFKSEVDIDEIAFWQETIVQKGIEDDLVLSNANKFRNYFRGLYFKAQANETAGNMFLTNLESTDANITIYYTKGEEGSRIQDEYVLNFTGNKLNAFINDFNKVTLADGDKVNGDETIYLKGLEGSMAIVDLFGPDTDGDMIPDGLDEFLKAYRKTDDEGEFIPDGNGSYVLKRLVNEAHIAIYEDETKVIKDLDDNGETYHKYDRIYAYDIKNNTSTYDYLIDPSDSNTATNSKVISLGQRDSISETEAKYKIRLTEHLNNIIQHDSTNYQIGLVLSNNVNYTTNSEILNSTDDVTAVPSASIISPRGTILYGSHESVSADKRLAFKVFYTEIKED